MTEEPITRDPADIAIGQRVREGRKLRKMTQVELGVACDVTFQQIQKYEKGSNRIACSTLVAIARELNQPVPWFFEGLGLPYDPATDDRWTRLRTIMLQNPVVNDVIDYILGQDISAVALFSKPVAAPEPADD